MRVYLDDERKAPQGWVQVRWPEDAITLLRTGQVMEISLDHDLGDDERGTGYDVLLWLEEQVYVNDFRPPMIHIHTANSSARQKMEAAVISIYKLYGRKGRPIWTLRAKALEWKGRGRRGIVQ